MQNKIISEEKAFIWKTKTDEVRITSMQDLLNVVLVIDEENVDEEIKLNLSTENTALIKWLELNFPHDLKLVAELKVAIKEFTPQQLRELIAREIRVILS